MFIRQLLVVAAVVGLGLLQIPSLLAKGERRELLVVSALLLLSLTSGLTIVTMPEGASVAKFLAYWVAPLGEALLGPM